MAMSTIARPGVRIAALAVAGLTALAACSSSSGSSSTRASGNTAPSASLGGAFGTIPAPATGAQHAGTITWAESPGTSPTWILPIVTSAAYSVNDTSQFSEELWRPLYWFSNGVAPTQTPAMSLANPPVWSNGNTTATITLKSNYKWSDGQPITSRDVLFFFDEVKAAINEDPGNWGPYSPGLGIPDEVASVTTPNASTLVFTMKKAVNPGWFYDDELPNVYPIPAHAWAKASGTGRCLTSPCRRTPRRSTTSCPSRRCR